MSGKKDQTNIDEDVVVRILENSGDHRGDHFLILQETLTFLGGIDTMHIADILPGSIRGNHYHVDQKESVIVLHKDTWTLGWAAPESNTVKSREFTGSGAVSIEIGSHVAHALSNTGTKSLTIIALSDGMKKRDGVNTVRKVLL